MTKADLNLIDKTIQNHGNDFWNDPNNDGEQDNPNRDWIILELLDILRMDDLDLKVVRARK